MRERAALRQKTTIEAVKIENGFISAKLETDC